MRAPLFYARSILLRVAVIWLVLRVVVTGAAMAQPGSSDTFTDVLRLTPSATLLLIAIVTSLALIDARRRKEVLFLANLGVSRRTVIVLAAVPTAVFEIALRLV